MEVGNFTIFQFLTFRGTLLPQNIYLATHIRVTATNAGVFFMRHSLCAVAAYALLMVTNGRRQFSATFFCVRYNS